MKLSTQLWRVIRSFNISIKQEFDKIKRNLKGKIDSELYEYLEENLDQAETFYEEHPELLGLYRHLGHGGVHPQFFESLSDEYKRKVRHIFPTYMKIMDILGLGEYNNQFLRFLLGLDGYLRNPSDYASMFGGKARGAWGYIEEVPDEPGMYEKQLFSEKWEIGLKPSIGKFLENLYHADRHFYKKFPIVPVVEYRSPTNYKMLRVTPSKEFMDHFFLNPRDFTLHYGDQKSITINSEIIQSGWSFYNIIEELGINQRGSVLKIPEEYKQYFPADVKPKLIRISDRHPGNFGVETDGPLRNADEGYIVNIDLDIAELIY